MAKILIVEDNQGTNKAICEYMKEAGHTLFSAFTGNEALKIFREKELDIIVLDIMLPEMSGIVVLHEIRKISNIPVIMLTALDDEYTQSNSFDEMADDYITKPFSMLILGKRITALLRRSQNKPAVNTVKLGDITVDFSGYTASDENGKIDITPKELEILKVLIDNKGLVLSRNQILDEVWGYDCDVIDRTIDAYIRNIRKKLRLKKAISNILSNAVNYTEAGQSILVVFDKNKLSVSNECSVLPPEQLQHIFEPFYRPDLAHSQATGGNGLGLYIVQTILDKLRLKYQFVPMPNDRGMSFTIQF